MKYTPTEIAYFKREIQKHGVTDFQVRNWGGETISSICIERFRDGKDFYKSVELLHGIAPQQAEMIAKVFLKWLDENDFET